MDRRHFLKMVGTAGVVGACTQVEQPVNQLIPFVVPPDDVVPGLAAWYSSVCQQCPSGCGIVVKIQEGQAKKIEGNPAHPVNRGKLCAMGESALQVLYNPDRIKQPLKRVGKRGSGEWAEIPWEEAYKTIVASLKGLQDAGQSDRLYFIGGPIRGHISKIITQFMTGYGTPHFYSYELYDTAVLKAANEHCFGVSRLPHYDIAHTDYLLSFGANFLETWISPVGFSKSYGEFRQGDSRRRRGKFVQCEPRLSLTAANADQWVALRPGSEGILALGLAHIIIEKGGHDTALSDQSVREWRSLLAEFKPDRVALLTDLPKDTIHQLAKDFSSIRPSLALCGSAPMARKDGLFHAVAVNILNLVVGNVSQKGGIQFFDAFEEINEKRLDWQRLSDLPEEIGAGQVKALFLNDANFLFHSPDFLKLEEAIEKIPFIVGFSSFMDETTVFSDLILPTHTPLEAFGDMIPEGEGGYRSVGLMQPVVPPLYETRPLGDIFIHLAGSLEGPVSERFPWDDVESFLKETWEEYFYVLSLEEGRGFGIDFRPFWSELLQNGGRWDKLPSKMKAPKKTDIQGLSEIVKGVKIENQSEASSFSLQLYPSIFLYDGRGANQPWLQEAPDPMTTITWGSWIEIHHTVAERMGIKEGDLIQVTSSGGSIEAPAYPTRGLRPDTLAMPIGQGHTAYGRYAKGRGVNPLKILSGALEASTASLAWGEMRVSIKKTGKLVQLAKTEGKPEQIDHQVALSISGEEARQLKSKAALDPIEALPSRTGVTLPAFLASSLSKYLRPEVHSKEGDYRWGMVIDLDRCTGCGACNVACHAENNLPIVGEEGVKNQREINWIRVERYWPKKPDDSEQSLFLPMLCQHCANAPCEPVCPVYATYHTPDGLNAQIYNRCVGTRYCAVNCPYKVRSFNWSQPVWPEPLDQQLSNDLSVRDAGVMEKCTFCVQRIRLAKEDAKIEKRMVRDGEIQPACVQSCPADAMRFGSLLDHKNVVSQAARDPRRYRVLEHLNTESAVIYLKRIIDA